ncbi:MAG: phytanoyl-CoA dioxygenase family protein [Fibrobacteria bacterium]
MNSASALKQKIAYKVKHRVFYRSFLSFFLFEKFFYRRYRTKAGSDHITSPSGRRFAIAPLIEELKANGIVALPGYYGPEQAETLHDEILALNAKIRDGSIPADEAGNLFSGEVAWSKVLEKQGILRIHNVQKINEKVAAFHTDPNFSLLGSLYFGKPVINLNTISQYNEPTESGCRGYHIDSHLNQFKSFIYLNDVTEENGPHDYLIGSNSISLTNMRRACISLKTQDTSVSDEEAINTGYSHRTFPGSKGTVLLVDTRGIHQGANLRKGHRLALTGYYYLAEDWPNHAA